MPRLRFAFLDVFTDRPLRGNQLAVFTDGRGLDQETMQALAREIGFSETVFLLPAERGGTARTRIFTPRRELPFAGHPVLGAAWLLAGPLQRGVVELETARGLVSVEVERDESGALTFARMEQPVPTVEPFPDEPGLLAALGIPQARLPVETYDNGVRHTLVALPSEAEVAALRPDLAALAELGVAVSCFAGDGRRWKTRMFAPALGVPEDAATGSAAGPLACHLCRHGLLPWGTEIEIHQGAEIGRPSILYASAAGEGARIDRVRCGGQAVIVARGELRL
jgi:trans-2,3-dihydro-3-hydroxyanthranilate isomerase